MNARSVKFHPMPLLSRCKSKVAVLADGRFPENELVLNMLKSATAIVCCDGAAAKLLNFGLEPSYIVGDLDSLSSELKGLFADRIFYSADQETNDLTKAVKFCLKNKMDELLIVGATGLREDHTLANISLLADYAVYANVCMLTDTGVFTPILATSEFESANGQQVSVFSLTPDTLLSLHGLRYPVSNRCFTSWWQGTLNEALGCSFKVEFESGKLIVFRQYI